MSLIIRTNRELRERYDELQAGDCFFGMLSHKYLKHRTLIDLLERGIRILPSALAQMLTHSKVAQAQVLGQWMMPHTMVVTRRIELLHAINLYNSQGIGAVVTKEDHLQCGVGVHFWKTIEEAYNHASFAAGAYPFVLQPFLNAYTDVRVVVADGYWEAYTRENPNNFRKNLSAGGSSKPYNLSEAQLDLCRRIMARGKFPFAHVDLLVTPEDKAYLSEIALNGGLKGARIERRDLDKLKERTLEGMIP